IVPQQNSTASVSTTANVTYDLSATTEITVNLTTNESTAGTVAIAQFNTNPESVAATSANGFAALGLSRFVAINASAEVEGNLSWYILNIYYSDAELPATIDESTLRIYYFNSTSGEWQQEADGGVDTSANRVWANITHFSVFSAGGAAEAGGSGGGGGGGGGGSATASKEPIVVTPTFSVSLVEAPKNQQISVVYEGNAYLFKVAEFTGSMMVLKSLPDLASYNIANGLTSNFDLDNDGRFDIQISYSGSYGGRALVVFYLVSKPETIALLPPAPRKPREQPAGEETDAVVGEKAAPDVLPFTAPVLKMPEPAQPQENFLVTLFEENKRLITYLGTVAGLIVVAFLVMHLFTRSQGPKPPTKKELKKAAEKTKK
ncbi:hypothetical protein KY359_04160, partial [Candidatus Woesearchaeota archaeon]|nr:hypothetical protein [Candidatus Woesearchaeota archaeon]